LECGSRNEKEVGSRNAEVGNWKWEIGSGKLEVGSGNAEVGKMMKLEIGEFGSLSGYG